MSAQSGQTMAVPIAPFSSLPLRKDGSPYNAWGFYGDDDERGAFNRLTPELVLKAKDEIQTGRTISLNNPLDVMAKTSVVGRKAFEMNQYAKLPRIVCDDVWTLNSQCSTQWDGLRHWANQKTGQFYNGHPLEDLFNEDKSIKSPDSPVLGIQNWEKTGIVGRGILLDFERWRRAQGIEFSATPLNPHKITVDQLRAVAEAQGTEIKFGDLLFIRMGFTKEYAELSDEDKKNMGGKWMSSGLVQNEETLEYIWRNFSAVAADNITLEYWRKSPRSSLLLKVAYQFQHPSKNGIYMMCS